MAYKVCKKDSDIVVFAAVDAITCSQFIQLFENDVEHRLDISPINTVEVNKWWDSLPHKEKEFAILNINRFSWGKPNSVSEASKHQKELMYIDSFKLKNS